MKKFIAILLVFAILTGVIVVHSIVMYRFGEDAKKLCGKIETLAENDKWENVSKELKNLKKLWDEKRLWASLTMRTNVIEEIDTSLAQSESYAKIKQKPDFLGEFIMLRLLLEHIPHQEGLHIEEIL